MQQKRKWMVGGAVVAVALGAAVALGMGKKGADKASDGKPPEPVMSFAANEVAKPMLLALVNSIDFSGPLVAPDTAIVRAKAAGTLLKLQVAEGSRVRAGQALGTLDLADLTARLNERLATAESARAQLAQADRTHQNNLRLADQQFISPSAVDASKAALDSARAQHAAALSQVETVRIGLRDAALVAPISGIVAKRHVVPGEKVSAEQQVLTIVDLASLEMAGTVGTHEVPQLNVGMPVTMKVEGMAEPIRGVLSRIAPAADVGTRSIGVAVKVPNPGEKLRAGQYATARVALANGAAQLTVPTAAIGSASGQQFVWTVEGGKLLRRTVTTGRRDASLGLTEVLEGLKPDVMVLAMRFENLREGGEAKLTGAAAPAASASAPASSAAASASAPAASSAS